MIARKKTLIICLCIIILLISVLGAVYLYQNRIEALALEWDNAEQEQQLRDAYWRVNIVHYFAAGRPMSNIDTNTTYRPFMKIDSEINRFEIDAWTYLLLKMYEYNTGNTLAYEVLMDFFAQEFEPDGLLRLYNNGRHLEIQMFVEWMWSGDGWDQFNNYLERIGNILREYSATYEATGFVRQPLQSLSPQMLDALARAVADPEYVLDLSSLQRAGY